MLSAAESCSRGALLSYSVLLGEWVRSGADSVMVILLDPHANKYPLLYFSALRTVLVRDPSQP